MNLRKMFNEGHLEDDKHNLGILVASVEHGVIRYRGHTYWNCDEMMKEKEG